VKPMNTARPVLTTALSIVTYGVICLLIGRGAIPAAQADIVQPVALAGVLILLFWLVEELPRAAQPIPAPVDPGKPPVVPVPDPKPPVKPAVKPRFTGITATSFGGSADPNTSAYDKHLITDTELGAALPFHFPNPVPSIRVFCDGHSVDCKLVDVGPWNVNDPYWTSGARPEAETGTDNTGRRTNLAGIDLTPGAWKALGKPGVGKAKVDWDFVDVLGAAPTQPSSPASSVSGAAIIAIVTSLDGTHWTDGSNPTINSWIEEIAAKWPDRAAYARTLENHGYFAWCGLTCAYVMTKAGFKPPSEFYAAVDWLNFGTKVDTPQPGDVLVYQWHSGSDAGGHHVSIYDHETDGDYYASHGGNQSHAVNITQFPMSACIGIRRPA